MDPVGHASVQNHALTTPKTEEERTRPLPLLHQLYLGFFHRGVHKGVHLLRSENWEAVGGAKGPLEVHKLETCQRAPTGVHGEHLYYPHPGRKITESQSSALSSSEQCLNFLFKATCSTPNITHGCLRLGRRCSSLGSPFRGRQHDNFLYSRLCSLNDSFWTPWTLPDPFEMYFYIH